MKHINLYKKYYPVNDEDIKDFIEGNKENFISLIDNLYNNTLDKIEARNTKYRNNLKKEVNIIGYKRKRNIRHNTNIKNKIPEDKKIIELQELINLLQDTKNSILNNEPISSESINIILKEAHDKNIFYIFASFIGVLVLLYLFF